jgi:hypothetical protein
MKNNNNTHTSREVWLREATHLLRPLFEKLGYTLPDKIRLAVGFPSSGKRGRRTAECWHPSSSADQHFEIFIRPDIDDPVEVLGKLVPQLIHTLLPIEAKHGKAFRDIALRIGLEGPMRQTTPTVMLKERLQSIASALGPLPHAKLDFATLSGSRKKAGSRYYKAACPVCAYAIRVIPKWAKMGLPLCPVSPDHGAFVCDIPNADDHDDDGDDNGNTTNDQTPSQNNKTAMHDHA